MRSRNQYLSGFQTGIRTVKSLKERLKYNSICLISIFVALIFRFKKVQY